MGDVKVRPMTSIERGKKGGSRRKDLYTLPQVFASISVCFICISAGNILNFTLPYYSFDPVPPSNSSDIAPFELEHVQLREPLFLENGTLLGDLFLEDFGFGNLTRTQALWTNGIAPLGAISGSIFSLFAINYTGPKASILWVASPLLLVGWFVTSYAPSFEILYLGRFIGGIGVGVGTSAAPIYVSDAASLPIRGSLGILQEVFITLGALLTILLGLFFDWRVLALICGVLIIPVFLLLPLISESPLWLITKHRPRRAEESLRKLLGRDVTSSEFQQLRNHALNSVDLTQNRHRRRQTDLVTSEIASHFPLVRTILTVCLLMVLRQFTGVIGIGFYAESISKEFLKEISVDTDLTYLCLLLLATLNFLVTCTTAYFIETLGRKILILTSLILTGLAAIGLGIYYSFVGDPWGSILNPWLPLASLLLFNLAFSIGLGPVPWVICQEISGPSLRPYVTPVAVAFNWLGVFLVGHFYMDIVGEIGHHWTLWILGVISFLGLIFVFWGVPETRGKGEAEIRLFFTRDSQPKLERWIEEDMEDE